MARQDAQEILALAGWTADRDVSDLTTHWESELLQKGGFVLHGAARSFLREFGGLAWPRRDAGEHFLASRSTWTRLRPCTRTTDSAQLPRSPARLCIPLAKRSMAIVSLQWGRVEGSTS